MSLDKGHYYNYQVQHKMLTSNNNTAKDCLSFIPRDETPPKLRKYRSNQEPGSRILSRGTVEDIASLQLEKKVFGVTNHTNDSSVKEIFECAKSSPLQLIESMKAERMYKSTHREALGKPVDRGVILPTKFTEGKASFGICTKSAEGSFHDLLFPHASGPVNDTPNKLLMENPPSEGSALPDVQMSSFHSSQDMKDIFHHLQDTQNVAHDKRPRNTTTLPPEITAYGKTTKKGTRSVAEVMKGKYTVTQQQPDEDLGRSITPGFRNNIPGQSNAVYGCPSTKISSSVHLKCMLDPTATTHSLLHPPTGSSCLSDTDIFETTLYSRSQLIDIYKNIGKELTMEAVDKVFHSPNRVRENKSKLSQKEDSMSLKSFQDILNRME